MTYNSGLPLAQKHNLEKNLAAKPITFFLQKMIVLSYDVRNVWVEGPSYWRDNAFMELFTQNILDKEGLNNSQVHLRNERGFLKYNYNLLGNTV